MGRPSTAVFEEMTIYDPNGIYGSTIGKDVPGLGPFRSRGFGRVGPAISIAARIAQQLQRGRGIPQKLSIAVSGNLIAEGLLNGSDVQQKSNSFSKALRASFKHPTKFRTDSKQHRCRRCCGTCNNTRFRRNRR